LVGVLVALAPDHGAPETNPFTLPSDEEVFRMRESEKQRKEEVRVVVVLQPSLLLQLTPRAVCPSQEKRSSASFKIYEKGTASSKIGNIRRVRVDDPVRLSVGSWCGVESD
jgi:hypothetical protein